MDWHWTMALWIPVFWIWQVLRHEGAHALAAILMRYEIRSFVFWPHRHDGHFYWGRVEVYGPLPLPQVFWFAPVYAAGLALLVGALILTLVPLAPYWFTFVVVMLDLSPAVSLAFNVWKFLYNDEGDLAEGMRLQS